MENLQVQLPKEKNQLHRDSDKKKQHCQNRLRHLKKQTIHNLEKSASSKTYASSKSVSFKHEDALAFSDEEKFLLARRRKTYSKIVNSQPTRMGYRERIF